MLWTIVGWIPVAGPIVATVGKIVSTPVASLVCWVSKQPDHAVNAVCYFLKGSVCQ